MSGLDIDTRSDIYSLGIVLYELVAGILPFDPASLERGDFVAQHVLREKDAPTPSARFAALGEAQGGVAQHRHTTPVGLRKELKGDLDWIVLKAIEKDRTRRYETANGLALDLERLLDNQPVSARPPSAAYTINRFVRRHRLGVAIGAAAAVAVLGVAIAMTVLAGRISRERNRAELEAAKAKSINGFMLNMLSSADPWQGGSRQVTVEAALAAAVTTLDGAFKRQPLVDAAVRQTIGTVYAGLGRNAEAEPLLVEALRRRRELLGENSAEVAEALSELGTLRRLQGQYDSAAALFSEALAIRRRVSREEDLPVAQSLLDLALATSHLGNTARADTLSRQALAIRQRLLGPEDPEVANAMRSVAGFNMILGKHVEAEALSRPAVAIMRKTIGPRHPDLVDAINDLALERMYQGDFVEAEQLMREAVAMDTVLFGPMHPTLAENLENLGNVFYSTGRYDDSIDMLRQALNIRRTMLGDDHEAVGRSTGNMAVVTRAKRDYLTAQPLFEDALARLTRALGPAHPDVIRTQVAMGRNLTSLGRHARAESVLRDAVQRTGGPEQRPELYENATAWLAMAVSAAGRHAEAEPMLLLAYRMRDSLYGTTSADTRLAAARLDTLYQKLGRPDQAAVYREKAKAP